MGRLDGKVCVITGAGGGMGRDATQLFTQEGARVCAADVDLHRAPRAAIEDFLENRAVPTEEEKPPKRTRPGKRYNRYKSAEYHAWMMERDE